MTDSPDTPQRLDALLATVRERNHEIVEAPQVSQKLLASVHDRDFLEFLRTGWASWCEFTGGRSALMPNIYPTRHLAARPSPHPLGKAGFHLGDTVTPLSQGTWEAVLGSASAAAHAGRLVLDGDPVAYALCRPSGHHAHTDTAQGFCYLNNAAIAASLGLTRHSRVAIIDVDVHHGNGTQQIFYERSDVFVASIHCRPESAYPYFAGYADERGAGAGLGFNLNLPLAPGTGNDAYLVALRQLVEAVRGFDPGFIVVSLGLDAHADDLLGMFKLTLDGFAAVAHALADLERPTVLVQEGGYNVGAIGGTLQTMLAIFEERAVRG